MSKVELVKQSDETAEDLELYQIHVPNQQPKEPKPISVTTYKNKQEDKKNKKKLIDEKMKIFAETIGVEDNDNYSKFEENSKLVFNVSTTKYFVVRFVAKQLFNFRLSFKPVEEINSHGGWNALTLENMCQHPSQSKEHEDWDIFWTDSSVQPERIAKMKPYQKTNHFPGMFQLSRKNHLARNLTKMMKQFPKDYKFFPKTFLLPAEYGEYRNSFHGNKPVYIVKPEASCQGKGIFLSNNHEDVNPEDHYVVQQYVKKPLLIDGLKFDCRLYVLVLSVDPLRIYLFKEGLARFSTDAYQAPSKKNLSNLYMHLTNYAINCKNKGVFKFNQGLEESSTGHKRTFTSILEHISKNFEEGDKKIEKMMKQVEQIIIKTLCTTQPSLKHYLQIPNKAQYLGTTDMNSMCFEILGFDILIDEKLKPWLIEINHTPSFSTDTPLDFKIKKDLIADTIKILNMTSSKKKEYVLKHKQSVQNRMLNYKNKSIQMVKFDPNNLFGAQKRNYRPLIDPELEHEVYGSFSKTTKQADIKVQIGKNETQTQYNQIYPSFNHPESEYRKYLEHAQQLYEQFTGSYSKKKNEEEKEVKVQEKTTQQVQSSINVQSRVYSLINVTPQKIVKNSTIQTPSKSIEIKHNLAREVVTRSKSPRFDKSPRLDKAKSVNITKSEFTTPEKPAFIAFKPTEIKKPPVPEVKKTITMAQILEKPVTPPAVESRRPTASSSTQPPAVTDRNYKQSTNVMSRREKSTQPSRIVHREYFEKPIKQQSTFVICKKIEENDYFRDFKSSSLQMKDQSYEIKNRQYMGLQAFKDLTGVLQQIAGNETYGFEQFPNLREQKYKIQTENNWKLNTNNSQLFFHNNRVQSVSVKNDSGYLSRQRIKRTLNIAKK